MAFNPGGGGGIAGAIDVAFSNPQHQQVLAYNASTSKWQNQAQKAGLFVTASDYGAKGDGVTDDTASVQAAMNSLKAAGGGTLYFTPGTYYIRSGVWLCSNITITGNGATLIKKATSDPTYCIFMGSSGSTQGYGAGQNNITMHGLQFRGKFGTNKRALNAMALHHSDNILVYNCVFEQASGGGHRFDLQGCRYVTIRDCQFKGFDTSYGLLYNEDIQADYSTKAGGSFTEPDLSCYDGLASQHITVENNKFLPLTVGGVTYPAANPFGSHSVVEGQAVSYLTFKNNYLLDPVEDTNSGVAGVLHFVAPKNVTIEGNTIRNTTGASTPAIYVYGASVGGALADVQTNNPSVTFATPQVVENLRIVGNTISGFTAGSVAVRAHGYTGTLAKNIVIKDNIISDMRPDSPDATAGPLTMYFANCSGITVEGNIVSAARRLVEVNNSKDVVIANNTGIDIASNNITVSSCERATVTGNSLRNAITFAIYASASSDVVMTGNSVEGHTTASGPLVRISDPVRSLVNGNVVTGQAGTTNLGIQLTGNLTSSIITNNIVTGFTTPLTPASSVAGVTVSGNVTT